LLVRGGKPSRADDHEHHRSGAQRLVQCLDKIGAGIDAGYILKYLVSREVLVQLLHEPRNPDVAVLPTIADEDAWHACAPFTRALRRECSGNLNSYGTVRRIER